MRAFLIGCVIAAAWWSLIEYRLSTLPECRPWPETPYCWPEQ